MKDPDIEAAWIEARQSLAAMLRPHMVEHTADDLARRYVDGLDLRGWRPPLGKPHDVIAEARAARIQAAAQEDR